MFVLKQCISRPTFLEDFFFEKHSKGRAGIAVSLFQFIFVALQLNAIFQITKSRSQIQPMGSPNPLAVQIHCHLVNRITVPCEQNQPVEIHANKSTISHSPGEPVHCTPPATNHTQSKSFCSLPSGNGKGG